MSSPIENTRTVEILSAAQARAEKAAPGKITVTIEAKATAVALVKVMLTAIDPRFSCSDDRQFAEFRKTFSLMIAVLAPELCLPENIRILENTTNAFISDLQDALKKGRAT